MYTLLIQRTQEFSGITYKNRTEGSTISTVSLTDPSGKEIFSCFCCENSGPSTDTPQQDKRIVARTYQLEWTKTSKNSNSKLGKWQNKALWVTCDSELPGFKNRRILIHVGNYPQDTEGCLLFGLGKGKGTVHSSVQAITTFFNLANEIGPENIQLVVREIQ